MLTRPQSTVGDFYRELGHIFGVDLTPHNRWAGAKALREIWLAHIDASRDRPVLLVDEAQEMLPAVLSELRLLASSRLDARSLLTVVLAGDSRLAARLRRPELLPIASRIRARLSSVCPRPSTRVPHSGPSELSASLTIVTGSTRGARLTWAPT